MVLFAFNRISVEGCLLDGVQRNEADGFAFGFVRAVRRRPGNNAPTLDALSDQQVMVGSTLTLPFTAHDPDGDPISFFAQVKGGIDVPPGSTITDNHDGTATFTWAPKPQDVGDYPLRVAAFDEGGGEVFQDLTISVAPCAGASPPCPGDCNCSRLVTRDELVAEVAIALGVQSLATCPAADPNGLGSVSVSNVLTAVNTAQLYCAVTNGTAMQ